MCPAFDFESLTAFGYGPWVEWTDEATGLTCRYRTGPMGNWVGYVALPTNHCWHSIHHSELGFVRVHGRVTFSGEWDDAPGVWWIGFDCAHFGDYLDFAPDMMTLFEKMDPKSPQHSWTEAEVEAECVRLAKQILDADNRGKSYDV